MSIYTPATDETVTVVVTEAVTYEIDVPLHVAAQGHGEIRDYVYNLALEDIDTFGFIAERFVTDVETLTEEDE